MHNVGMIFTEIIRGIKGALCVFEEKKSPKQKNIHNINKVITPQYFCEIFPKADFKKKAIPGGEQQLQKLKKSW